VLLRFDAWLAGLLGISSLETILVGSFMRLAFFALVADLRLLAFTVLRNFALNL
jgi:hypothetical protein